ncbi:MAG: protein kinase [Chloroflexota bacterium]
MIDPLIGQTLGQYQIEEQLGQGGMATVYRGLQPTLGRPVAVKVLPLSRLPDPTLPARFRREARLAANLLHPNIVPVYDFGEWQGHLYIVMALLSGGTLKDRMDGRMPLAATVLLIGQVAEALGYAHGQGIFHRDVKPTNVLLAASDWAMLGDFGIARALGETTQLTGPTNTIGTPTYMAPEQWMGGEIDGRADIYALGVVLYELLTGAPPFQATTPTGLMHQHLQAPVPSLAIRRADLPAALDSVVQTALAKDPAQRFRHAGELKTALEAAARQHTGTLPAGPAASFAITPFPNTPFPNTPLPMSAPHNTPLPGTAFPTTPPPDSHPSGSGRAPTAPNLGQTIRVDGPLPHQSWPEAPARGPSIAWIVAIALLLTLVVVVAAGAGFFLAGGRLTTAGTSSSAANSATPTQAASAPPPSALVAPPPSAPTAAPAAPPPATAPPKPANVEPTAIPIVTVPPTTVAPPTLAPPPVLAKPTSPPAAAKPTVEQRKAQIERTIQGYFEALRAEDYARAQQVCCTPEWRSQYPLDTWKNNFKGVTDLYLSGAPRYQRVDDDVVVVDTDYTFRSGGAQRCFVLHWTFKPVGAEWKADIAAATPCQGR